MYNQEAKVQMPSKLNLLLETRLLPEFFLGLYSFVFLSSLSPKGDKSPQLVIPGLGTGDAFTSLLRCFLKRIGYNPFGWQLGANWGYDDHLGARLKDRLISLYEESGRKVGLIGISAGGIFADVLSHFYPDMVRQLVVICAPMRGVKNTRLTKRYEKYTGQSIEERYKNYLGFLGIPPPVSSTAIYSKTDGIVCWQSCLFEKTDNTQNIKVTASHLGLGFNPFVFYKLAQVLAQENS